MCRGYGRLPSRGHWRRWQINGNSPNRQEILVRGSRYWRSGVVVSILQIQRVTSISQMNFYQIYSKALFGHNPGMTSLTANLWGLPIDNIPTCGMVRLEFLENSWDEVSSAIPVRAQIDFPKNLSGEPISIIWTFEKKLLGAAGFILNIRWRGIGASLQLRFDWFQEAFGWHLRLKSCRLIFLPQKPVSAWPFCWS